jgi:CubicO group peptidase (beta-lactamase class C family)
MKFAQSMPAAPQARRMRWLLVSIASIAMAACGGGGGGGGGSTPPPTPPPTPPAQTNTAPTVQAGPDKTIELPVNSVALSGSATDAENNPLTYSWSATPSGVTFADSSAATTTATFPGTGTYTLTLTASDGTLSGSDSLIVTVLPPVYPEPDTSETDPLHGWSTITPEEAGMNPDRLAEAEAYATNIAPLTGAGMIVKGGRVVHYWGNLDTRYDVKSSAKSIGGMALGLALSDGLIADIRDRAHTYLPTVGTIPPPPPEGAAWPSEITLLQLATHTAGFAKPDAGSPLQSAPGTQWFYSDASVTWLADVLTQVYGEDLKGLLATRIFSRIGIQTGVTPTADSDDYIWTATTDDRDTQLNGVTRRPFHSGIRMNAHSLARIGLLFLRNGVWANDERLLPESFISLVQTPQEEVIGTGNVQEDEFPNAQKHYGVLWWTNKDGALPGVPTDAYWAWGLGDSLIVVIPSLDLVVVRAGDQRSLPDATPGERTWNDADWNGEYSVLGPFLTPIVQSINP